MKKLFSILPMVGVCGLLAAAYYGNARLSNLLHEVEMLSQHSQQTSKELKSSKEQVAQLQKNIAYWENRLAEMQRAQVVPLGVSDLLEGNLWKHRQSEAYHFHVPLNNYNSNATPFTLPTIISDPGGSDTPRGALYVPDALDANSIGRFGLY
jgi:hypothetical protein